MDSANALALLLIDRIKKEIKDELKEEAKEEAKKIVGNSDITPNQGDKENLESYMKRNGIKPLNPDAFTVRLDKEEEKVVVADPLSWKYRDPRCSRFLDHDNEGHENCTRDDGCIYSKFDNAQF